MNILLINHYAGSPHLGMEYRPFYLGREWVRAGHAVRILAASHAHSRSQDPKCRGAVASEVIEGIEYVWLGTPAYRGNGFRRIANMLAFVGQALRRAKATAREFCPDLVIASSTYPLDILPAYRIARLARAKLMFEVHDLWPLSPILLGGMSPKHPFIMLLQWAEDFAYRRADCVVSMLPNAKSYMLSRGLAVEKYLYVPNGVDLNEWQEPSLDLPAEHAALISNLKKRSRFLVGYAGAHGLANALDSVVRAGQLLRDTPVSLILVGDGPEKARLQELVRSAALAEVHFLPRIPRLAVPVLLQSMDAMIISLKRSPLFQFGVSPNKLMDYMAAGKPIIQAVSTSPDLVGESGCGISIPGEDPEQLANAIRTLIATSPEQRTAMGQRGNRYVIARHDYRMLAQEFLKPVLG